MIRLVTDQPCFSFSPPQGLRWSTAAFMTTPPPTWSWTKPTDELWTWKERTDHGTTATTSSHRKLIREQSDQQVKITTRSWPDWRLKSQLMQSSAKTAGRKWTKVQTEGGPRDFNDWSKKKEKKRKTTKKLLCRLDLLKSVKKYYYYFCFISYKPKSGCFKMCLCSKPRGSVHFWCRANVYQ